MFLAALLRAGTEQAEVRVRNMSASGAMIESSLIPVAGSAVHLVRGRLVAKGIVVWGSSKGFGLRFHSEVCVQAWLSSPAKVEQHRVDQIVALVKSGAIPPTSTNATSVDEDSDCRGGEQLAADVQTIVRLMQDLEDDLSSSDETLARHGMKLQHLDIAMQMLRAVAGQLLPGLRDGTSMARLQDLRVACAQALCAP